MSGLVAPFDDYQRLKYLRLQTSGPVRNRLTLASVLANAVLLLAATAALSESAGEDLLVCDAKALAALRQFPPPWVPLPG
jgi:hypothetical protein